MERLEVLLRRTDHEGRCNILSEVIALCKEIMTPDNESNVLSAVKSLAEWDYYTFDYDIMVTCGTDGLLSRFVSKYN